MASVLTIINSHIRRLARREANAVIARMQKLSAKHRRSLAVIRRETRQLQSELLYIKKHLPTIHSQMPLGGHVQRARFRADGLKSHRAKLGISAKDYGKLVGVSGLTIYHWEQRRSKPRKSQLPKLLAIRGLGKREAIKRLGG